MDIQPFEIFVPDFALSRLQEKLSLTELPDELDCAEWSMGVPLSEMRRLISYWRDGFDWRKQEREINEMPQFRTAIQVDGFEELKIHFVHQKSGVVGAIPLLFCHGCE